MIASIEQPAAIDKVLSIHKRHERNLPFPKKHLVVEGYCAPLEGQDETKSIHGL